ncbi:hypothetical protein ACHAWF_011768 [Thalassiosira exigua]
MHRSLTHWIKGAHVSLDYIKVPTGEWYYLTSTDELYHYDKVPLFCHHVLKVIPDDAREVEICHDPEGIRRVGPVGSTISWRRLSDKKEMEAHLLRRNKRHLQQVAMEATPPSQGYFETILSDAADELLEGETTSDMTQFPPVVRTWLRQFRRSDKDKECYPITGMIHVNKFQAAFRSVNEKTSSSPSGIHYTFWKSMASDCSIASYLVIMMRMPFMYGFINERWATSLYVMLEKKPGVRRIHQLRIIGLVEADFNTALKLYFSRHLVANTETTSLTEEQWGGRPGRTAAEPALRKMLAFEYGRIMYVTIALFANDATACFDRMVPYISTLIAYKSGMSKSVMQARNRVMASMRHKIRTSHGESHESFRQDPGDEALSGEGQGKGDIASLWSVLSHTLLLAHQELHEGLLLPHVADVLRLIAKNNDSFVDDTDAMASKCSSSFYLRRIIA